MARFYGAIGFVEDKEIRPGVWEKATTEYFYAGDVVKDTRRWQTGDQANDDLVLNNQIRIIADTFAFNNFPAMRYVKWMGALWKITNIEVLRPRLILTIGGIYNGP